jgi:hypothetical protein
MLREVAITKLVEVRRPQEDALAVIWAIQNIYQTEVKAVYAALARSAA